MTNASITMLSECTCLATRIVLLLIKYLLDWVSSTNVDVNLNSIANAAVFDRATAITRIKSNTSGGAGGHGTERDWIEVSVGGHTFDVFCKKATTNFVESFFLNLFDVYANELRFYDFVKNYENSETILPDGFFPRVYLAKMTHFQSNFLLLVENVEKTRATSDSSVSFPDITSSEYQSQELCAVLETQSCLHAEFFTKPPSCVWHKDFRPPFLQIIAQPSLQIVTKKFPDVLAPSVLTDYLLFLQHYDVIRRYWDRSDLTLVHGDAHLGNYYFIKSKANKNKNENENEGTSSTVARMYDFQCAAHEHPMRDVVYHVLSSVDEAAVTALGGDQQIIERYLEHFNANMNTRDGAGSARNTTTEYMKPDDAWRQYRLHSFWVLAAFIISAGAAEKLFETEKARLLIGRIARGCERVGAGAALRTLLRNEGILTIQNKSE